MASQVDQLRDWRRKALEHHHYDTAELLADKIVSFTANAEDRYWLAQAYYAKKNYLRGAELLEKSGDTVSNLRCRCMAARCLIKAEKVDEALAVIGDLTALQTQTFDEHENAEDLAYLHFLQGEVFTLQNNFDKAKQAYQEAVLIDPACYEAYNMLSEHRLLAPGAELDLLNSIDFKKFGQCADLVKSLYAIKLTSLRPNEAIVNDAFLHLKDEYDLKDNQDVMKAECDTLYQRCRFTACRDLCERVLAADAYNFSVYPDHLACLFEKNEANKLYQVSHMLADTAPDNPITWLAVGVYYMVINNVVEARRYFSKASIMDPYFGEAWVGFAHTFAQEGEHEQAVTAYSTAARLFPGSHMPYLFLGMQYLHLNNLSLAEEYFLTSQAICNFDPLVFNELGVVHYHRGELDRAKSFFDKAMALANALGSDRKAWAPIKANEGHVHRKLRDFDKALDFFEQVLLETPLDPNILTSMALVHLQQGHIDTAIERLNDALSVSRDEPIAVDLLRRAVKLSLEHTASALPTADIVIDVRELDQQMLVD